MINDYQNTTDKKLEQQNLFFGEVVENEDRFGSRIIKIRIPEIDQGIENNNLPDCYPAFPPYFHFVPQIGERVIVLMDRLYHADKTMNQEKRYYLSVTISQPQNIKKEDYYGTANASESDGWLQRDNPITELPDAKGSYLEKEDIGVQGRENTDIVFRQGEVLIRSGKHEKENPEKFNTQNPSYIQVRYGVENAAKQKKTQTITEVVQIETTHVINAVADAQNRLLIKVFRRSDNFVVEKFSASYDSREKLITSSKERIRSLQGKYPQWRLDTSIEELQNLERVFPNNQRVVKRSVEVNDPNEYNQFAGSVTNIVSEKINLLSHRNNAFDLTNPKGMITPAEQLKINTEAQPMVKGNVLKQFLELMKTFVATHVHPYHGKSPSKDEVVKQLQNFNLNDLLDENIRLG